MSRWLLLPLLTVSFALAQSERGNITGVVTDSTGASVAKASVTITSGATNISAHAVTTSTGEYNAPNLGPGVYKIEIAAPGFGALWRMASRLRPAPASAWTRSFRSAC